MADRVLSVRLQLEVDAARRAARDISQDLRNIGAAANGSGKTSAASLAGIGNAARSAGKAIAVGGGLAVGGMAAVTASVVKGGVAYNTLEQTSRAALTTLLGSASAATSQMEQLREFGKTSPFPRQVWISAQQQLLAFGMSAEKIIPTFQAVQDAVAAAGGGGQDISEVVNILAKVQSTGKASAETLNELGFRGIDAATLIGESMGKTASQVRADISAQAISGVDFIDQLTAAMATRFGGAAAGVKQTWEGAKDRIKGAVRDIGGLLASPLVAPEGGGAAVDWANGVADALRALEDRLEPVVSALGERAGPAVEALSQKLEKLTDWIKNADFGELGARIQSMLPAIAGVTAGFATMGLKSLPIVGNLVGGLKPLPVALAAAALASPELRHALMDLLSAVAPLLQVAGEFTALLATSLGPVLQIVAAVLQPVVAVVGFLADRFADLPGPVQMVITALLALKGMQMAGMFTGLSSALTNFRSEMDAQRKFADMAGTSVTTMGSAYSVAASKVSGAATGIRGALSNAAGFLAGPWGAAIGLGITALTAFSTAQDDAAGSTGGFTYEIDRQTGMLSASSIEQFYEEIANGAFIAGENSARVKDVLKDLGLTVDDLIGYLSGNAAAQERVNAAIEGGAQSGTVLRQFLDKQALKVKMASDAQEGAAASAKKYAGANEDGAAAAANASGAYGGLAGQLGAVGSATDDVAVRTQQLNALLSTLFNSQFAAQKASDDFQGGLVSLRNAFDGNERAAVKSAGSADKFGDAMRRQQKIVSDTRKQLEDLAEAQREAEKEAAEAARAARQRQLDELFGKQFDVASTKDAFTQALMQAGKDLSEAGGVAGARSLSGASEGALANRDRLRGIVQQAQAAIQAERDSGASSGRINQVTQGLAGQLAQSAAAWGLNTAEVKAYSDAIRSFGQLAGQQVAVDLSTVRQEFAEQRAEIHENSREQLENARASASTAAASTGAAGAVDMHTAALTGNSESAIRNRDMMRQLVTQAQAELTQMHLNGAGKEELRARGEELATQLQNEATQLGFTRGDVDQYTGAIRTSAEAITAFPTLVAKADTVDAATKIAAFVKHLKDRFDEIPKDLPVSIRADRQDIIARGAGHMATGGFVSGPGGPTDDSVAAWLSNGEYVINARQTAKNRALLEQINAGAQPAFAAGGLVTTTKVTADEPSFKGAADDLADALRGFSRWLVSRTGPLAFAESQAGKPYLWGGVGPAGYDCSGFMSAITNVIQKRNPHSRRFATGSFPSNDFAQGPFGNFMIGSRRGNPGHMAGTLHGVNVESRGGEGVVVGPRARGAGDRLFGGNIWHLKGYRDGGEVRGDAPFDLLSPLGKNFNEMVRGSFQRGTDWVPMDGVYRLHRGEAVVPAGQNQRFEAVLTVQGDGSRAADFVVDAIQNANRTGRLTLRVAS